MPYRPTGIVAGLAVLLLMQAALPADMAAGSKAVAAITGLMAVWWITEAVPLAVTALLPMVLFPLAGFTDVNTISAAYANHLVYLLLGGFLIGAAIQKSGLHHRIALHTIRLLGVSPAGIMLGFMLSTAFLSMWISNTAATIIMFSVAMAFIAEMKERVGAGEQPNRFNVALLLSIAYAASIGGIATLIGTATNAVLAGVFETMYGESINFVDWMLFAAPLAAILLFVAWLFLSRIAFKSDASTFSMDKDWLASRIAGLGKTSRQEKLVMGICLLVISLWIIRGFNDFAVLRNIKDSTIAMGGALLFFVVPFEWKGYQCVLARRDIMDVPWDVIILFGGGFALASGFIDSGLTNYLGNSLTFLNGANKFLILLFVSTVVIFLTEVTSNAATAAIFLPFMGTVATAMQAHPLGLMIAVAISASCAFMLPVATPPNAVIFGSKMISIRQMAMTGFWLNLSAIVIIAAYVSIVDQ